MASSNGGEILARYRAEQAKLRQQAGDANGRESNTPGTDNARAAGLTEDVDGLRRRKSGRSESSQGDDNRLRVKAGPHATASTVSDSGVGGLDLDEVKTSGSAEKQPPPDAGEQRTAELGQDDEFEGQDTAAPHQTQPNVSRDAFVNGLSHKSPEAQHRTWQLALTEYAKALSTKENEHRANGIDRATYREWALSDMKGLPQREPGLHHLHPPKFMSATDVEEDIQAVVDVYLPARREDADYEAGTQPKKQEIVVMEIKTLAASTNAEYLARPEIIKGLGYSQSIALMIGGKHHGKTTNIRTLALSVPRGLPIWGRATTQGPVIYVASDDELASTRNELLSMGWNDSDALWLAHMHPDTDAGPEAVIEEIAKQALEHKAILIILDMLFDFVPIKNELSYAETRGAIGLIQWLADETKALVVGSHHTPKYLNDAHNAANAALGSQGISARFSPIILTRKWTENLYTVESTMTRDPRGSMLKPHKITRNSQGWIEMGEEFKEHMKWEIYAQRVLDLFENPSMGLSVQSISEKLGIERSRIQNTVKELAFQHRLRREKQGRSYRYYLGSSNMFERESGNWSQGAEND